MTESAAIIKNKRCRYAGFVKGAPIDLCLSERNFLRQSETDIGFEKGSVL